MILGNIDKNKSTAEPIIPIDFTPNDEKGSGITLKFRSIHFVLLIVSLVFGFSGWFVLTAKSVFVEVTPITAEIEIEGGINIRLGQRYLIRSGDYSLSLTNDGYHEMTTGLNVTEDQSQTHSYQMDRLPGVISIITEGLAGARAKIDGVDVGTTPISEIPVEYGNHRLEVTYERDT